MKSRSEKSMELYQLMLRRGYREEFCYINENFVHASDSVDNAEIEISRFLINCFNKEMASRKI